MPAVVRYSASRRLPRVQRWAAWLAIAQYLTLCSGLPLPVGAATSPAIDAGSRPFPCRDHRCGCRTAEQCWKSCCCYTPTEKLAWAKANGVPVPVYAGELDAVPKACCVSADDDPPRRACCRAKASSAAPSGVPDDSASRLTGDSDSKSSQWVVLIEAQRCNGGDGATTWLNVPISLPIREWSSVVAVADFSQPLKSLAEPSWVSAFFAPPEKPPRTA